jgi:synaptic vesicle membrane protein VAT-1
VNETLRRIVIEKPGGFDALKLIEEPLTSPAKGEVRIKVTAAGLNYADGIIRMGLYASAKELHGYPITPGFEVSGVIDALGDSVTEFNIGDRVIGVCLFNGYRSHINLATQNVFRCPDNLDLQAASGIPTVFLTAWFMTHQQVFPRKGDRWLVHSAAGGVGSALVQLGKLAGAEVTGVVGSEHKRDYCMTMGCKHVIVKSKQDLWSEAKQISSKGFDAIFDANGVSTLQQSYDHLAPMGKLCIYGFASMLPKNGRLNWFSLAIDWLRTPRFNPLKMTQQNRSVLAANLSFLSGHAVLLREGMLWLLEAFARGDLKTLPIERFPLADAAKAQQRIESGQTVGKLVLIP